MHGSSFSALFCRSSQSPFILLLQVTKTNTNDKAHFAGKKWRHSVETSAVRHHSPPKTCIVTQSALQKMALLVESYYLGDFSSSDSKYEVLIYAVSTNIDKEKDSSNTYASNEEKIVSK